VQYVVIGLIVVVGGSIVFGILHVRHESSPGPRPSLTAARRDLRQSRSVTGDLCVCGGTLQPTGEISAKYGVLQGCGSCRRRWTEDGRKVVRRPVRRAQPRRPRGDMPPS
jgi:hypothetical protein